MNFSKSFLWTFSLLSLIFQILIIKDIPGINSTYLYVFVISTSLAFMFNSYATYKIKFDHGDEDKSE